MARRVRRLAHVDQRGKVLLRSVRAQQRAVLSLIYVRTDCDAVPHDEQRIVLCWKGLDFRENKVVHVNDGDELLFKG